MYIAMNRFSVTEGREEEFKRTWRERDSYLDDVPGFKQFALLRGEARDGVTLFVSHSEWESHDAFVAWTKSEAFRLAHRDARTPKGVLQGHPQFEGFAVVEL